MRTTLADYKDPTAPRITLRVDNFDGSISAWLSEHRFFASSSSERYDVLRYRLRNDFESAYGNHIHIETFRSSTYLR